MTLSMELALEELRSIKNADKLKLEDLGFILTTFRDNATDDDLHKLFSLLVDISWEEQQKK
ncbi:hypothetical protein [Lysinibacillus fusiformis]|uniref:hypothetical protein n=1 Tax=Lysinibacillus fusiformis TaxID=28031 RepID=UPI003D00C84C